MDYSSALKYIHSLGMFSHPAGLERITAVLKALGNPQNAFDAIHLAGTNGKGSTATFISSIFRAEGLKTGLFISPFIIDFTERIQINGKFIPEERLCALTEAVRKTRIALTEFEFITAIAFLYFAQEKCDIAVIETGLGGRFDATNALTRKKVSVITKIGLDHTAILGNTYSKIAAEKCGIIKGEKTVSAPRQPRAAASVIKNAAVSLTVPDMRKVKRKCVSFMGNSFSYKGNLYKTALGGDFQIDNAVTAIEAVRACGLDIKEESITAGLANAQFPARQELFDNIILDGAHNPDGAAVLREAMLNCSGEITAIVGMMKDKNTDGVLKTLLPLCKTVIAVKASDSERSLTAQQMAQKAQRYCKDVIPADSLPSALETARLKAGSGNIFIFGSLYLASEIRPLLIGK